VLSQPYVDRILDDVMVGDDAPAGYDEAAAAALALSVHLPRLDEVGRDSRHLDQDHRLHVSCHRRS